MSFAPPTFNLLCNIYNGPWLTKTLRIGDSPCNLALGKREQQYFQYDGYVVPTEGASIPMGLLLPALTDVRDGYQGWPNDIIEVPSGSNRWYQLTSYDDVGKGFPNEYRFVQIMKIGNVINNVEFAGLFWPTPAP
jgi:hypothetical protein